MGGKSDPIASAAAPSEYGSSVTRALPDARQVADRWHLLENASRAFVDAVRKCPGDIRKTLTKNEVSPALLTAA